MAEELAAEKRHIYPDPGIEAKIDSIPHERLVCISDFYAGEAFLKELIEAAGFSKPFGARSGVLRFSRQ